MVDRGDHRIGDSERQQAIDLLRTHTGAGRLTLEEFSDLAGEVYAAQTYGELEAVARNMPPGLLPPADAAAPVRPAGAEPAPTTAATAPPASGGRRHRFVAVMSGSSARGRWRAASRISAVAFWGGVHVDLRKAEIEGGVIDITAWAVMGGVSVTVAEGTPVELDGMVLMGGSSDLSRSAPPLPGAPLVRVHARGLWGGVTVQTRKTSAQRAVAGLPPHAGRSGTLARPMGMLDAPLSLVDDVMAAIPRMGAAAGAPVPVRRRRRRDHHDHHVARTGDGAVGGPGWGSTADEAPPLTGTPVADDAGPAGAPPAPTPTDAPAPAPGTSAPTAAPGSTAPGTPGSTAPGTTAPGSTAAAEPGAAAAARPSGTLTMMVTDIADSTALAERLGDRRWIAVLGDHNALVREQVARHGGTEVKAQGDGFLVVFPSARRAILAAVDVQRALARYGVEHPETTMAVRIGLHTGEIVDVDGDVLGQNVVVAVRIADHAVPGEVLVSALTRDLTVSGGDLAFGPATEVTLKGLSRPWRVHRVMWTPEPS